MIHDGQTIQVNQSDHLLWGRSAWIYHCDTSNIKCIKCIKSLLEIHCITKLRLRRHLSIGRCHPLATEFKLNNIREIEFWLLRQVSSQHIINTKSWNLWWKSIYPRILTDICVSIYLCGQKTRLTQVISQGRDIYGWFKGRD